MTRFLGRLGIALALASPTASYAADPTNTGVLAGLGLVAGAGKTTVTGSAGAIEAAILSSDAFLAAGSRIRAIAAEAAATDYGKNYGASHAKGSMPTILLLTHTDTLDFTMAHWVQWRLGDLLDHPPTGACKMPPKKVAQGARVGTEYKALLGGGFATPAGNAMLAPADLVGMLTTDISLSGIPLTQDDRLLLDAVLINRPITAFAADSSDPPAGANSLATFRIPGETADVADPEGQVNGKPSVFKQFSKLEQTASKYAECDSSEYKAYLAAIQSFATALTAADKGTPPLATAAELGAISGLDPYVLRLAIEQSGGTAITRSNIWYELGFPGAATVSAGLLVTFRLSDPRNGLDIKTGYVRCAIRPVSFRDLPKLIQPLSKNDGIKTVCGAITS